MKQAWLQTAQRSANTSEHRIHSTQDSNLVHTPLNEKEMSQTLKHCAHRVKEKPLKDQSEEHMHRSTDAQIKLVVHTRLKSKRKNDSLEGTRDVCIAQKLLNNCEAQLLAHACMRTIDKACSKLKRTWEWNVWDWDKFVNERSQKTDQCTQKQWTKAMPVGRTQLTTPVIGVWCLVEICNSYVLAKLSLSYPKRIKEGRNPTQKVCWVNGQTLKLSKLNMHTASVCIAHRANNHLDISMGLLCTRDIHCSQTCQPQKKERKLQNSSHKSASNLATFKLSTKANKILNNVSSRTQHSQRDILEIKCLCVLNLCLSRHTEC